MSCTSNIKIASYKHKHMNFAKRLQCYELNYKVEEYKGLIRSVEVVLLRQICLLINTVKLVTTCQLRMHKDNLNSYQMLCGHQVTS